MEKQNVILYTDDLGHVSLEVSLENETVWLSQKQMAELFDKNVKTINEHIGNMFKEGELEQNSVIRNFRITASDGKNYDVAHYNLDVIISVGYRVKSKRGTQFRIWASNVLKQYLIKGYALNHQRMNAQSLSELTATMELVRKSIETKELSSNEAKGLLDIINNYAKTWALLQGYDSDALYALQGTLNQRFILDYDEAKNAIFELKKDLMAKDDATELFGNEKAGEFKGALLNIYQTFGGVDLLPSVEEKAANLLYYVIKDHAFSDGNKRIGSFLFILFLHKNGIAYKANGEPKINDNALVSLALLVAASEPSQKELMVKLITNLLSETD
ncbi:virulence RhuM family protein [Sulfurospirillum diekertiae]|uniref:Virulence RhuM family protein n=1 Tax=Sulfurospirillum diekertiae TaxID=1854492 RepID=A0A6G9VQF8_9BACT|nr:RhuM family protein [Sulfurospirillum diekertiae]QIR74956.1 virulence RhuM family protein [Sulfurospirillum diekertiae]QIR77620.1 virulence RhuM family protein [Sulfurospirillum diekertiae]